MVTRKADTPSRRRAWGVALAALAFGTAPFLTEPFTGYTADQLPIPQPDPVIQPPGWAFSIWGVIYLWLVAGSLYGAIFARATANWDPSRLPLLIALGIGTAWLWIANASAILGTVTLFMMAAAAIAALLRAPSEGWPWLAGPIGLFAGWLTAASGVSLAVTLTGFAVMSEVLAAVLALILVIAVALAVLVARPGAWTYAAGAGWALFGVAITGLQEEERLTLALAALGLIAVVAVTARGHLKPSRTGG